MELNSVKYKGFYLHVKPSAESTEDLSHLSGVWVIYLSQEYSVKTGSDAAISTFIHLSGKTAMDFDIVSWYSPPLDHADVIASNLPEDEPSEDLGISKLSSYYDEELFHSNFANNTNKWHKLLEQMPDMVRAFDNNFNPSVHNGMADLERRIQLHRDRFESFDDYDFEGSHSKLAFA